MEAMRVDRRASFVRGIVVGGVVAGGIVLLGAGVGQPGSAPPPDKIVAFAATDEKLFRVWESGRIEFLGVDLDNGTANGVPDWSPVKIDTTRVWDSRGRNIRKK